QRIVVVQVEARIDAGESLVPWVKRAARVGNPGGVESGRVGNARRKGIEEASAGITNEPHIGPELDGMGSLCPRDVVTEVMHRCRVRAAVNKGERRVIGKAVVVQSAKLDDGCVGVPGIADTLPGV